MRTTDGEPTAQDRRLVGRAYELAAVRQALVSGTGSGALLTGEPGVGKSRLLGAALDELEAGGAGVVRITATPSWQDVPFGSVPGFAPPDDAGLAGAFRLAKQGLTEGRPAGPAVVGIDDVNWLDDASAALLERLLTDGVVKVLATVRNNAANTPVVALVRRAGALDRIDVRPLDRAGHDDLVTAVLGGPVSGLALDALWRTTLGNPLFVREALRAAVAERSLQPQEGVWNWRSGGRATPRLYDAVELTVGVLSDEEAAALAFVAYAEPLRPAVLDRLVAPVVAEQLEERGLIRLVDHGAGVLVRLGHPLFGEAIRARTKPLRRRRLLRELVEAMQGDVASVEDRIRVMSWRCEADLPFDLGDVLAAADAALDRGGAALAERLARSIPGPMGAWYLGRAQVAQGRPQDAEPLLATAYARLDAPVLRARAAALRALNLFWGLRQPDVALSLLEEAHRQLPESVHGEMLVAGAGIAVFYKSDVNAAAAVAAALQEPPQEPLLAVALTPLLPFVLVYAGAPRQAAAELADSVLPQPTWPTMRAATQACHIHALVMCGRLEEAAPLAERYYQDAVAHGSPDGAGLLAMMVGICHGDRGRVEQAARWTNEALAVTDARTLFPIRANILGMQAWWAAHQGRAERATQALTAVDELLPADSRSGDYARLAKALLLASTGRPAAAVKILRDLAEQFIGAGVVSSAMEALHLWSRVEPSAEVAAEVRRVAEMSDSPLFSWFAEYADALADADPDRLEALSLAWEQRSYTALALESAVRAWQARPDAEQRASGRLLRRIAKLRDRCDGHWPGWLVEPVAVAGLTRREREICALAAAGLSNAEISVRLVLSVRTVENHLQRAYDKLGIRQRGQLADALHGADARPTPG
ncbi:helix-turn-helix transcriptional regulator [Dactylosporangium fulvum]|uniref:LuxR C-terminal-related transcriptional regulator n=1 Tax=Dactylosporangium fulvum TaxID=53359 RepID=A0ABY5VRM8_9ACTN|nr:LuxR family transcriptional regulator [Dactylosporangium fulvum]UWP79950.1 LuxR C-terminal-related transcriptional regulator [Dactylosporangium fulvum]